MASSIFQVGNVVRSTVTAQGMKAGWTYEVEEVASAPFGSVVYWVRSTKDFGTERAGHILPIRNGHLLLSLVSR